jgi:hypothetical protein
MTRHSQPSARLLRAIRTSSRGRSLSPLDERRISDAYREILREYRAIATGGRLPGGRWRDVALEALRYLGGDADRLGVTLRDYDHHRYGPFLGISDDGDAADDVCRAALASPKAQALGARASPLTLGVALDAERLGGVGEVPVGSDEFCDIWLKCAGLSFMTTNVGSRVNVRYYLPAPVVTIADDETNTALAAAKANLAEAFSPFLKTPDKKPLPLVVFVEFKLGSNRSQAERETMLQNLLDHVKSGVIAAPGVHRLGLNIQIDTGPKGQDDAFQAIDIARATGIRDVSIDGVVRKAAGRVVSLPGLTNYLAPDLVAQLLRYAQGKGVKIRPLMQVDPDTVARSIWSALNTARAMSLHLGKYGLFPLTLEESELVVKQVQQWFLDWAAAPVFYVDQGIIGRSGIYVGRDTAKGVAAWLRVMAKHKVNVVLIDTVDKSKGWKLLRTGNDPKGLLSVQQISRLAELGESLGIKILWAGGITGPQAYELGKLGVFGIYVTTSAAITVAVKGKYRRDPGLAARKQPTFAGVLKVKTLIEAGYLSRRTKGAASAGDARRDDTTPTDTPSELDLARLAKTLPAAWREWWRANA